VLAILMVGATAFSASCGGDDDAEGGGGPTAVADPDPEPDPDPDPEPSGTEEPLEGDLVVYSGRREPLLQPVIEAFEEETGIDVSVKYGATNELGNALVEEKGNPRADVFVGTDAASAESLRSQEVFASFDDPALEAIDAAYRAPDGSWVGISGRARVIIYNTELVEEADLPQSIFDVTDQKWDGQIAIPSTTNGSFTAWVSSIRVLEGDEAARDLLQGLKDNGAVAVGDHTAVRQAVGRGEFALGLVNHYYYQLEKDAGSPVGVIYTDQGDGEIGVLLNVAAASIVEGGPHSENAQAFMRYLLSPEAQELFAALNFEYPLIPGIEDRADYKRGTFKESDVDLHQLGAMNDSTIDMIDEVALE
jgi:iron(III) transport system substrate-binding protein